MVNVTNKKKKKKPEEKKEEKKPILRNEPQKIGGKYSLGTGEGSLMMSQEEVKKRLADREKIFSDVSLVPGEREGGGYDPRSEVPYKQYEKEILELRKQYPELTNKQYQEFLMNPEKYGFEKPGIESIFPTPEGVKITPEPAEIREPTSILEAAGKIVKSQGFGATGLGGQNIFQFMPDDIAGAIALTTAGIGAGLVGWEFAAPLLGSGGTAVGATEAVQAGTAAKTASLLSSPLAKIAVVTGGAYAFLALPDKLLGLFYNIEEQQQAVNTLGQITSTIVGDSTSGAGDWRKGLQELKYLEQEILKYESAIKAGEIKSLTLKYNGKIYDLDADIADQLSTIREGIADIQTFALQGQFPELSEPEMQALLRRYEAEGYIKPVDLTKARRPFTNF